MGFQGLSKGTNSTWAERGVEYAHVHPVHNIIFGVDWPNGQS